MDNSAEVAIKITHYINPHQFYFKFDDGPSEFELQGQTRLDEYCNKQWDLNRNHELKKNNIVAAYVPAWNKWVRAVIDDVLQYNYSASETNYVLWAMDEG